MSETVYIVGVGMTRFGKWLDRSVKSLVAEVVESTLSDAVARVDDVEAVFYANSTQGVLDGQHCVRGQIALRPLGFEGIPITNIENACAGASSALHHAIAYVKAGCADVVLAIGAEKMVDADKRRSMAIFDGAWDVHEKDALIASLASIGDGQPVPEGRGPGVPSPFMELYASLTKGHMARFGTTERHLAQVASKNHGHSVHNERAQFRAPMSVEQILAAPLIQWPLTLPMCSPISDGAAAALVCSASALSRFTRNRAVRVLASVLASGRTRRWEEFDRHVCRLAARKAYEQAGVGPDDISVAEVHDASAFAEILQTELLGFCPTGEGGALVASGATTLGGRIPVNPSGGLESKGHPIGATGLGQIFELVQQLRGEAGARQVQNARLALAENGGGFEGVEEAAAAITILGR